jgi:hypothetical protein
MEAMPYWEKQTIIPAHEGISPVANYAALCDFLAPFKSDVHVTIDRLQVT